MLGSSEILFSHDVCGLDYIIFHACFDCKFRYNMMDGKQVPCRRTPCANCPFRKDCLKGWLGERRAQEIANSDSFVCHKNTQLQCAGHMILLENGNTFWRMMQIFNIQIIFDQEKRSLIFDTVKEFINHHKTKKDDREYIEQR